MPSYQRRNYNRLGGGYSYNRSHGWGIGVIIAVVVLLIGFYVYEKDIKTSHVTFTVQSKERVNSSNSSHYMVFATNNAAYTVSDNILHGHTDSSNLYASLREGHEYECETNGWRFSLFSSYENIIACKELK